jgi:hypothetical protein
MNNLEKLAETAYIYGFPLIFNLEQIERQALEGIGALEKSGYNNFTHSKSLAKPSDEFVSINNDTIYSNAPIDLSVGPLILDVPDTNGRYYVLQFIDAWSNNFAYIGKRATGTKEGRFFLSPPNWKGDIPDEMTHISFPSEIGIIVGRFACDNEDDFKNVSKLQKKLKLTQKSRKTPLGIPKVKVNVSMELEFFEKLRIFMKKFPSSDRFSDLEEKFTPLGVNENETIYNDSENSNLNNDSRNALINALIKSQKTGLNHLKELISSSDKTETGWQSTLHAFDYNLDYFELGTINSQEWKIKSIEELIGKRAGAALAGLWGNHGYEAAYFTNYLDENGDKLNGENVYVLHLDPLPPVDAFWSITMYNLPNFYLVENKINRYSIGDRTEGLKYNRDGSLDIYISYEEVEDCDNWLPAPNEEFRPLFRMYQPKQEILDEEYKLPPIKKVN